ncbi:MAG: DUF1330 domain-containing protein [Acetobacteraceae bacterium]
MPAYVVVNIEVTDPAKFTIYGRGVPSVVEKFGGRYLVRGGELHPVEGDMPLKRLVILEFPSMTAARAWYASPDYAPLLKLRMESSRSDMVFVEGYLPPG